MKKWIWLGCALGVNGFANPQNPSVAAGEVRFETAAPNELVIETSQEAIINWESFSIGADETTRFIQPNARAAVLNRVISGNPSELLGRLEANGSVYLVNPNGVLVSEGAVVNTQSFIVQNYDLPDELFLAHDFSQGPLFLPPARSGAPSDNPYAAAIRQYGKIEACRIESEGGRVFLLAEKGAVEMKGSIEAAGGDVRLLGEAVFLPGEALIDVSCDEGGGSVKIGGDFHGNNPKIPNAFQTAAGVGARILANAEREGNGGSVVVWADEAAQFFGQIEAKGGPLGGDGGFAEVSGKRFLDYQGLATLTADRGSAGTLLLDPTNITVMAAAMDTNVNISAPSPVIIMPTGAGAVIRPATIIAQLGASNVIVEASAVDVMEPGDVTISSAVNYTSAFDLTFRTANLSGGGNGADIRINAQVRNTGSGSIFIDSAQHVFQTFRVAATGGGNVTYSVPGNLTIGAPTPLIQTSGFLSVTVNGDLIASGAQEFSGDDACSVFIGGDASAAGPGITLWYSDVGMADITVGGNLDVSGIFQTQGGTGLTVDIGGSFSATDGVIIRTTAGVGDPLLFFTTGGDFVSGASSIVDLGSSASGLMTFNIGGDFLIQNGNINNNQDPLLLIAGNDIQLQSGAYLDVFNAPAEFRAGRDVIFTGALSGIANIDPMASSPLSFYAGRDVVLDVGTRAFTDGSGSILMSAGRNFSIGSGCTVYTMAGDLTLICDGLFPAPPGIGTGAFSKDATALLESMGALKIFTANRDYNSVAGDINMTPYVPGPEFVDSATEIWNAYYPHNSGFPFTLFYKNGPSTGVSIPFQLLQAYNEAAYEFLQTIQKFDRFAWDPKQFSLGSDAYWMVCPEIFMNGPHWFSPSYEAQP